MSSMSSPKAGAADRSEHAKSSANMLRTYFEHNESQHQDVEAQLEHIRDELQKQINAGNERDDRTERDMGAIKGDIGHMHEDLTEAFERIEVLEHRLEQYAEGDALQAKLETIYESYQSQVELVKTELETVRESLSDETTVRATVQKVLAEQAVSDRMRAEMMTKQRRLKWVHQAFSRFQSDSERALLENLILRWRQHCQGQKRLKMLLFKALPRVLMLRAAQTFSQWAGEVRSKVKQQQKATLEDVQATHADILARFDEDATLARLEEIEKIVTDETSQTRSLVQDFFEYQHQFEVDLVADRAEDSAEQRARLTKFKVDVMGEVERLETRVREELVGCVVRCDGITRDIDRSNAERAEVEEEIHATQAKTTEVSKQLAGMQRLYAQNATSDQQAIRKIEDKIRDLQTRGGQTQKEVHACRTELRTTVAAAAKARGQAALSLRVEYDDKYQTRSPRSPRSLQSTEPALADDGRSLSDSEDALETLAGTFSSKETISSIARNASNTSSQRGEYQRPGSTRRQTRHSRTTVQTEVHAQVDEGIPQAQDTEESPQSNASSRGNGSLKSRAPALPPPLPGREGTDGPSVHRPQVSSRRRSRGTVTAD